ncbi:MAG: TVP38/TMEM64 family protein [Bdellovibrionales bacterium]|nr:TVP38/TMEM64 family protein [Bdellovibrionales bacterium]
MNQMQSQKYNLILKKLLLFFTPLFIIISIYLVVSRNYFSLEFIKSHFTHLQKVNDTYPVKSVLIYSLIYIFVSAAAIPGAAALSLLGGALFGFLKGTVLVSFTSTIGSTLAFLFSRYLLRDILTQRFSDKLKKLNKNIEKNGSAYLFFLRLNPVIPFFMINSLMGLTSMSTIKFFRISQLGMLPGTILYLNAGTQIGKINHIQEVMSWKVLLSFFLLGLFPLLIQLFTTKKNN